MENLEKKEVIKNRSIRMSDEDYAKFSELGKSLGLSQPELMKELDKTYHRLQLEAETDQGENLKTLRNYSDKIIHLFTTMVEATEEKVKNEQDISLTFQKQHKEQIITTKEIQESLNNKLIEQEKELIQLQKEAEKHVTYQESVEGRIADKDALINAKNVQLQALTQELLEVKDQLKQFADVKAHIAELTQQIDKLHATLKEKDLDTKQQLLNLRIQLHDESNQKIETILENESNKRDRHREDVENRLRAAHKADVEQIKQQYEEQIKALTKPKSTRKKEQQ